MKNLLFLFVVLFSLNESKSQVVFNVVSNSCDTNVVGTFLFEYAGELDGSSTDWDCPDITNPANAVQGCLVFINDSGNVDGMGTPPITINYAFGCDTTNSAQDLTGKIAVIYRGICEFGFKAFNAQNRGAIGVVIINHTGDAEGMSGGVYGELVTIPVIQIGRADGDVIAACVDTVCNGVVGFIGKPNLTTGIKQSFIKDYLLPYPNPTSNLLTVPVRKGVFGNVKVEVIDITGKLVLSDNQQIDNELLKVNLASIKNGMYLFQLTFADGTTDVFKISVNR